MVELARNRPARREFRNDMFAMRWNRERFHPFKRTTETQWDVHETEVVAKRLATEVAESVDARGNYNRDLAPMLVAHYIVDTLHNAALQQAAMGAPIPQAQMQALEGWRNKISGQIDKKKKERDEAIARETKMHMVLYCQQHGLRRAEKLAKRQFWRMAYLLGVEKANEMLSKLFNDMLKAVVEGKLGVGAF